MREKNKTSKTFTLLEFILALGIMSAIAGAVGVYLKSHAELWDKGRIISEMGEEAHLALGWLERDIRDARTITFAGEQRLDLVNRHI